MATTVVVVAISVVVCVFVGSGICFSELPRCELINEARHQGNVYWTGTKKDQRRLFEITRMRFAFLIEQIVGSSALTGANTGSNYNRLDECCEKKA